MSPAVRRPRPRWRSGGVLAAAACLLALWGGAAAAQSCPFLLPGQSCPAPRADAFAFLPASGSDPDCPNPPIVHWVDPRVTFECGFFESPDMAIECGGTPQECAGLCAGAANGWTSLLPGRFLFLEADASTPVDFCNPQDGRTSIGGSMKICDDSEFGPNVLAVTLRVNFATGPRKGELVDADITVNQRFNDFFTPPSFFATVGHEFGHVLGLDHPDQCDLEANVIMRSASICPSDHPCFVVSPTDPDVTGAQTIYAEGGVPTPMPTPAPLCGDADGSGAISVTDGVQTLRAAAQLSTICTLETCDMDGSGSISVTDGVNVLRGAAGLPFTSECPA